VEAIPSGLMEEHIGLEQKLQLYCKDIPERMYKGMSLFFKHYINVTSMGPFNHIKHDVKSDEHFIYVTEKIKSKNYDKLIDEFLKKSPKEALKWDTPSIWMKWRCVKYSKTYNQITYEYKYCQPFIKENRRFIWNQLIEKYTVRSNYHVLRRFSKGCTRWLSLKNIKDPIDIELMSLYPGNDWIADKDWASEDYRAVSNAYTRKAKSEKELRDMVLSKYSKKIRKHLPIGIVAEAEMCLEKNVIPQVLNYYQKNPENADTTTLTLRYLENINKTDFDKGILHDYLRMKSQNGRKSSLKFKSNKGLVSKHDKLAADLTINRLKQKKNYKYKFENQISTLDKELVKYFGTNIKLIDNSFDLALEGYEMSHCVANYCHDIRRKSYAVWSIKYPKIRFTLGVKLIRKDKQFHFDQLCGVRNESPNINVICAIKDIISKARGELWSQPQVGMKTILNGQEEVDVTMLQQTSETYTDHLPF